MSEVKITKIKYVIQYKDSTNNWTTSDWNDGVMFKADLTKMLSLLRNARENMARCVTATNGLTHKEYRLVKQTHSITTEVVDE